MKDKSSLKYVDAEDKSFGVAGMAIATVAYNFEKYLDDISLDRDDLDSVRFSNDYLVVSNSSLSPKAVWQHSYKQFQLESCLLISNVVCRNYIHFTRGITPAMREEMLTLLCDEGRERCQLDPDEVKALFVKNIDYIAQTFSSREIYDIASRLARRLAQVRSMTRAELLDYLSAR